MNQTSQKAIKTIAGGIFHSIVTNHVKELSGRDWELLCSHLKIHHDTIHSITIIPNGFTVTTKTVMMRYVHDVYSVDKRKIEIRLTSSN